MAKLTVNNVVREHDAEGDTPLLWVLREQLGLTGTKYGCGLAQCGACTVHIDGVPTRSCVRPVSTVQPNEKIVTIEGLSSDGLHPVQKAFSECHALQCGFCTPGMIMAVAGMLKDNPKPNDEQIIHGLEGNLCRCTGYINIVKAVKQASGQAV